MTKYLPQFSQYTLLKAKNDLSGRKMKKNEECLKIPLVSKHKFFREVIQKVSIGDINMYENVRKNTINIEAQNVTSFLLK